MGLIELSLWDKLKRIKADKDAVEALKGVGYTEGSLKTHEDRLDTLEGADTVVGSVAKSIKDAVADLAGTGRTTETVKGNADAIALRELSANKVTAFQETPDDTHYPSEKLVDDSLEAIKGVDYTDGTLKSHEDRLDTLEGTGEGSVAKAIDDYAVKLTKMPDGATAVYSQDAWATTDGWVGETVAVTDGGLKITSSGSSLLANRSVSGATGKHYFIRIKASKAGTTINLRYYTGSAGVTIASRKMEIPDTYEVFGGMVGADYNGIIYIQATGIAAGDSITVDWIWIGDYSYLENSLSTEASRIANQLGDTAGAGTKASGTITSNGTNVSDGDTVTIAGKVYTFKTILGTTEGQVLIGGTAAESLDNLKLAINSTGVTAQQYCVTFHPLVEATTNTDAVQTLQARTTGILGNSITLAKSASTLTLSGSTLTGGTDDVGQKIYTQVKDIVANGRPAQADISDTSTLIGYENSVDVASGGTTTLPAGGTFRWAVYGYGATIGSAKKGTSAGGTVLTVAGANATVWYRRIA